MNAWYQYTGNRVWLDRINGLIDGIDKIVEHKGDYAYFPVYGRYEGEYLRIVLRQGGLEEYGRANQREVWRRGLLVQSSGPRSGRDGYFLLSQRKREGIAAFGRTGPFSCQAQDVGRL